MTMYRKHAIRRFNVPSDVFAEEWLLVKSFLSNVSGLIYDILEIRNRTRKLLLRSFEASLLVRQQYNRVAKPFTDFRVIKLKWFCRVVRLATTRWFYRFKNWFHFTMSKYIFASRNQITRHFFRSVVELFNKWWYSFKLVSDKSRFIVEDLYRHGHIKEMWWSVHKPSRLHWNHLLLISNRNEFWSCHIRSSHLLYMGGTLYQLSNKVITKRRNVKIINKTMLQKHKPYLWGVT